MTHRLRPLLAALVLASTPSCSDGTGPTGLESVTLLARPHVPSLTISPGIHELGLGDPLIGRDGFLYIPPGYDPAVPAPLLVLLHGAGSSASEWDSQELRDLVDPASILVLAIDSRSFSDWDLLEDGAYGRDVAFLDDALAWTFDRARVDPTRIAIGGFSDGATEVIGIGLANGDLFAHVIAFSPGSFFAPGRRGSPGVFVSHGTEDGVLPYANTSDNIVPSLITMGLDVQFVSFEGGHEVPLDVAAQAFARLQGAMSDARAAMSKRSSHGWLTFAGRTGALTGRKTWQR